jgi:hypothetical protein
MGQGEEDNGGKGCQIELDLPVNQQFVVIFKI